MIEQLKTIRAFIRRCADSDTMPSFAATEALTALAQLEAMVEEQEPVQLDHIACIDGGELRYMTGRKAPRYDCELYAMPDGKRAAKLYAAPVAQQQEPVAWAMPKGDGTFIDVITPAEHAREEGSYTVPLFAHPAAQQPQAECRSDGRCQYAIDSGAEGLGHCPKGKCVMQQSHAKTAEVFRCKTCGCTMQMPHDDCLACERGAPQQAEAVREQLRAAQVAATMPLIGPLLDAWDGLPNDLKYAEELSNLRKQIGEINMAMEGVQPQQAEAVPSDVVRDAERYRWLRNESWAGYNTGRGTPSVYTVDGAGNRRMMLAEEAMDDAIDAAIAQQKGQP